MADIEKVVMSGCTQTTFYPLMASPAVERSLAATVGKVDYSREQRFYEIICKGLTEGDDAPFTFGSCWTFNTAQQSMIDEYIVDYELVEVTPKSIRMRKAILSNTERMKKLKGK